MKKLFKHIRLWLWCKRHGLTVKEFHQLSYDYYNDLKQTRGY